MANTTPPPLATASSPDESMAQASEQSTSSTVGPVEATAPENLEQAEALHPQSGHGLAMFSTDFGKRPKRKLQPLLGVPVIARSDMVRDVVAAAGYWRNVYPYFSLNIFPRSEWTIHDLWDDEDIHFETEDFCKALLQFLERDNVVRAQKYSQEWTMMHPERLPTIGGDMAELYDNSNPLSVVDKIFVNHEWRTHPPVFLWHVAHMIRGAMLAVKGVNLSTKETGSLSEHLTSEQKEHNAHNVTESLAKDVTMTAQPAVPDTAMNTSPHVFMPALPMSGSQPGVADPTPPFRYTYSTNHVASGSYIEHMGNLGYMTSTTPSYHARGIDALPHVLRNHRTRQGRAASSTSTQYVPPNTYLENPPRPPPGFGRRPNIGSVSVMHSPRHSQGHIATGLPMVNINPGMVPFGYEQASNMPGMTTARTQASSGMVIPYATHNSHGFQGQSTVYQPYTSPMGDITNLNYAFGVTSQNANSGRQGNRRYSQQHMNSNVLFDPYEGSNPAFKPGGYSNSKKYNANASHHAEGRQRKTSAPGGRPYHSPYTTERSEFSQTGTNYSNRYTGSKVYREFDHAVTEDLQYGCNFNWIGPFNETVTELFVKDLPENVQDVELRNMFLERGFEPVSILIKGVAQFPDKRHAFVGFSTPSITKQALLIGHPTIRGLPVSISVPKRFFQKIDKTKDTQQRDATEAGPWSYSRYTSNPNNREFHDRPCNIPVDNATLVSTADPRINLSYSPQDARSDLNKSKKKGKQTQQGLAMPGSPEARKTKPKKRQDSSKKESRPGSSEVASVESMQQPVKTDGCADMPERTTEATSSGDMQTENHQEGKSVWTNMVESSLPAVAEDQQSVVEDTEPSNLDAADGSCSPTPHQQKHHMDDVSDPQPMLEVETLVQSKVEGGRSELPTGVGEADTEAVPVRPSAPHETVSDNELKNETGFNPPTQSQVDLSTKVEVNPAPGSLTHGTASVPPEAPTRTDNSGIVSSTPTTGIAFNDVATPAQGITTQDTVAKSPSVTPSTMPPVDSIDTELVSAAPAPVTGSVPTEHIKKVGAQHTESLHPFSKVAKAQAKKEKEQRKKAQKREKELAEKSKLAKATENKVAASSGDHDTCEMSDALSKSNIAHDCKVTGNSNILEPCTDLTAPDSLSEVPEGSSVGGSVQQPAPLAAMAAEVAHKKNKKKKGKAKKSNSNIPVTADDTDADHGKHVGDASNENCSVTNKQVKIELPKDAPVSNAQPADQGDTNEPLVVPQDSSRAVDPSAGSAPAAKKKKPKKKKAPLVWPDLSHPVRSPNPAWMGPIDSATDVENYDTMIETACGGLDDSDFSWSSLPRVEDILEDEAQPSNEQKDENGTDAQAAEPSSQHLAPQIAQVSTSTNQVTNGSDQSASKSATLSRSQIDEGIIAAFTEAARRRYEVNEAQIAANNERMRANDTGIAVTEIQLGQFNNVQTTSNVSSTEPPKKKKPNKHNNKKKKKKMSAGTNDASASSSTQAVSIATSIATSAETPEGSIDSTDPFSDQMMQIEAIERGQVGGDHDKPDTTVRITNQGPQCDEPELMRTMEAYFKETQGDH